LGIKIKSSIIFLGTGGDSFVVSRQLRSSGGIILQVDDNQFHIDPGPGALARAADFGVNLRANTAVLVSHNHLIHCNDINAVIYAMTYSGFDKKGVLVSNSTIANGAENYQPFLMKSARECLEKHIILEPGKKVGINEVEIRALKAVHSEPNTIGFKFLTPYYTLSYSADTMYTEEIAEQYKNSNILILNVLSQKKEDAGMNLCIGDAVKIINAVKPRLAIITHFGINMVKANPLYEVREIQKQTGVHVIAANDGMIINPISHSIESAQKTIFQSAGESSGLPAQIKEEAAESNADEKKEEQKTITTEELMKTDKPLKELFKEYSKDLLEE